MTTSRLGCKTTKQTNIQTNFSDIEYKIDCINYFVQKASIKKSVLFGFLDSFLDEQNNLYSQCLFNFSVKLAVFLMNRQYIFSVKLAVFYEQKVHLTTLNEMYPKFTCSCRVQLSIKNEHVFCRKRVFYTDSNSTYIYVRFLLINQKGNQTITVNFKGTAISAITIYILRFLYSRQPCLPVYGPI